MVKFYGTPSGVGTDPTATLYLEGTNDSRVEVKTDSGFLENKFVLQVTGDGTQTTVPIVTINNGLATLPVFKYQTGLGGFGGLNGLLWEAVGVGVDTALQLHSAGGACEFLVTSGDALETQSFWIGYAPSRSVASGKTWLFQYDATTDDLIFKSNNTSVITSRMSIDFASGVISATTANYETLVTADQHVTNKKYVDDLVPVKEVFEISAGAGQTAFALPSTPPTPTLVTAYRNGVKVVYGVNFTVSGSTLTWLDVPAALVAGETISGFYNETGLSQLFTIINKSASDTAALNEAFSVIEYTNGASDYAFTLPQNSVVAFPIGSWIEIRKTGSGEITITKGAGTTFRGALGDVSAKIDGSDGFSAFAEKTATDTWLLSGSVKAV